MNRSAIDLHALEKSSLDRLVVDRWAMCIVRWIGLKWTGRQ